MGKVKRKSQSAEKSELHASITKDLEVVNSKGKPGKGGKKKGAAAGSNIVYIGHLAHGFYEREMRKFFSQFGKVGKLKLFRSKKTNNSKGYAFVEFESSDTAAVVAEALDGYYLHEKRLVCNVVAPEKVHTGMFKTKKIKTDENNKDGEDDESDVRDDKESDEKAASKYLRSMAKKQKRLKELGIDFLD